jgi:hypothetical protein
MNMKRELIQVAIGIALITVGSPALGWAQAPSQELEGSKPYIPSRLEWLALQANIHGAVTLSPDRDYTIGFVPIKKEDTIIIHVRYLRGVDRERMNRNIDGAREIVLMIAKGLGWDSWVKVKEDIAMLEDE